MVAQGSCSDFRALTITLTTTEFELETDSTSTNCPPLFNDLKLEASILSCGHTRRARAGLPPKVSFEHPSANLWEAVTVPSSLLATAADIVAWQPTNEAKQRLPDLIRRLCLATANEPTRIQFPGVTVHGYDGVVEALGGDAHVPQGRSVWELSAQTDHRGKVEGQLLERSNDPGPFKTDETIYVACVLKTWDEKEDSVAEWKTAYTWKDIKLYDNHDLETWLQRAVAVHIWFSRLLGRHPVGAWDSESYWTNWSNNTSPSIAQELVLRGYENQTSELLASLQPTSAVVRVRAQSRDLARAFVVAALSQQKEENVAQFAARTVVVTSPDSWQILATEHRNLILIPTFDVSEMIGIAQQGGHSLVLCLGQGDRDNANAIELGFRSPSTIEPTLASMFNDLGERNQQATRAAYSFTAFRRSHLIKATLPPWGAPEQAIDLLPALLIGEWDARFAGDRELICRLLNESYESWIQKIGVWLKGEDPPLMQRGTYFRLTDREDSWNNLAHYLSDHQLASFQKLACELLSVPHSSFALPIGERWRAGLNEDFTGASTQIRSGVADTLALLGALGDSVNTDGGLKAHHVAHVVVREVLAAQQDSLKIEALSPYFQKLAEAAPDAYLSDLETKIKDDPNAIAVLFQDKDQNFLSSSSPHVGLLWSLETLAWSPDYLARAAIALGRLHGIDPGGKLMNRPIRSLREIFLLWSPHTNAEPERRMAALESLCKRAPDAGWELLVRLIPTDQEVSQSTSEPSYRRWGNLWRPNPTRKEVRDGIVAVAKKAVVLADDDPRKWIQLSERLESIPEEVVTEVLQGLRKASATWDAAARARVWESLQTLIVRHSQFPDADWSLGSKILDDLRDLVNTIEPSDPKFKWRRAFARYVEVEFDGRDYEARDLAVELLQAEAALDIYSQGGAELALQVAEEVEDPARLGLAIGRQVVIFDELGFFSATISTASDARSIFARAYAVGRRLVQGEDWLRGLILSEWALTQPPSVIAGLLVALPFDANAMAIVDGLPEAVRMDFWKKMGENRGLLVADELVDLAIDRLRAYRQYSCALHTLSFARNNDLIATHPELVLDLIDEVLRSDSLDAEKLSSLRYPLIHVLDLLDVVPSVNESRLAGFELVLANLFSHQRPLKALGRVIQREPETFLQLIEALYIDDNGNSERTIAPDVELPYQLAYEVIHALRRLPGQTNGDVDSLALLRWVRKGRELARTSKRVKIFDSTLGGWLARSPVGRDGLWPHEAVRDVLEELESPELEEGFDSGVINSRGVTGRAHDAGGEIERKEAARYRQLQRQMSSWPRTARALGLVAESFDHFARNADERRDRRQG